MFKKHCMNSLSEVSARGLIFNGVGTALGEWPCHAAVFHRNTSFPYVYACGATIISKKYLLTAAHCMKSKGKNKWLGAEDILIRAGITNIAQLQDTLQERNVSRIVRIKPFNISTLENDIALLKVEREFVLTTSVRPIGLWLDDGSEELIIAKRGYVVGWGGEGIRNLSETLHHAVMPVVSRKTCKDSDPIYYTRYLFDRKTLCAGFRNGTSAGPGDSGGGLYIEHDDGRWLMRGIISNGKLRNKSEVFDSESYVVFTDVAYYIPWMRQNIVGEDAEGMFGLTNENYLSCGRKTENKFLRNGTVEERKWPWQGVVYRNGSNVVRLCEAVIISENFMLSAADAYSDGDLQYASQLMVVFEVLKNGDYTPLHKHRIARIILHEDFQSSTRLNNIALLEMRTPLRFSDLLRPVCYYVEEASNQFIEDVEGQMGELTGKIIPSDRCNAPVNLDLCFDIPTGLRRTVSEFLYQDVDDLWYLRGIVCNVSRYEEGSSLRKEENPVHEGSTIRLVDILEYTDWIHRNTILQSDNLLSEENCAESTASDWMPHLGRSEDEDDVLCYASLISSSFVLATAACVVGFPPSKILLYNQTVIEYYSIPESNVLSPVKAIHVHPSYDAEQLSDNIAIIELQRPVSIAPICLPKTSQYLPDLRLHSMLLTRWPSSFQWVPIRPINIDGCSEKWEEQGREAVLSDGSHICGNMISEDEDRYYCDTDFPALPLFYNTSNGVKYLRGILDIAKEDHCRDDIAPEVFVDVMHYAEWIADVVLHDRG